MKYIELSQGQQTIVDDDLYDWLNQWKWYYRKRSGNRKGGDVIRSLHYTDVDGIGKTQTIYMAALLCPVPKGFVVDHIDQDPLNNQRRNLRQATYSMNSKNIGLRTDNKLKERFIHWAHHKQRYIVQIRINGIRQWSQFKTLDEAKEYRDKTLEQDHT